METTVCARPLMAPSERWRRQALRERRDHEAKAGEEKSARQRRWRQGRITYPPRRGRGDVHERDRVRHIHCAHEYHLHAERGQERRVRARERVRGGKPREDGHKGGHRERERAARTKARDDGREKEQLKGSVDQAEDAEEEPDRRGREPKAAELQTRV
jgi:hypothetical protein